MFVEIYAWSTIHFVFKNLFLLIYVINIRFSFSLYGLFAVNIEEKEIDCVRFVDFIFFELKMIFLFEIKSFSLQSFVICEHSRNLNRIDIEKQQCALRHDRWTLLLSLFDVHTFDLRVMLWLLSKRRKDEILTFGLFFKRLSCSCQNLTRDKFFVSLSLLVNDYSFTQIIKSHEWIVRRKRTGMSWTGTFTWRVPPPSLLHRWCVNDIRWW